MKVDCDGLASITVTYNPDIAVLLRQLRVLPASCLKVVVDNGSSNILEVESSIFGVIDNVIIKKNNSNLGLAKAVNIGAELAAEFSARYLLMLDQDSEPEEGAVEVLYSVFTNLSGRNEGIGCVGPAMIDVNTGLSHGFHLLSRGVWLRVNPERRSEEMINCTNLNGSGTLTSLAFFRAIGGLDEGLFIDHVDTEWSFRVLASGKTLIGVPQAEFLHRMGNASRRIWLMGWRVWPERSPFRHYYLFRNAVLLMRRGYVPLAWKVWSVVKLLITVGVVGLVGPNRRNQLLGMLRGIGDGIRAS